MNAQKGAPGSASVDMTKGDEVFAFKGDSHREKKAVAPLLKARRSYNPQPGARVGVAFGS